ncbi:MAG TPA: hypothetical protein VMQ60_05600, partial [Acidobacteriaceae bacterium]|nr:hypothetical protein [Acidobacteriaceae bacterium]
TVTTPARAKTITLDRKTGHLLLITAEYAAPPAPSAPAAAPPAPAPGAAPAEAGRGPGGPGGFRGGGRGGAMVPGSFEIVVVGK